MPPKLINEFKEWYDKNGKQLVSLETPFVELLYLSFVAGSESGPTPHAPDKSGDSLAQAEPVKSSNPPVESDPS